MKRTISLLLALVMALTLCLTGCGNSQAPASDAPAAPADAPAAPGAEAPAAQPVAAGEPVYGGTATFYYTDMNTVFDPAMGEMYVYSLWMEYLFTMDWEANEDGLFKNNNFTSDTAQGQIAESWEFTPLGDGTADLTVKIRDDIYFQEKAPEYDVFHARNLTAADVKYSYDRITGFGSGFDETNYVMLDADWRTRLRPYFDANAPAASGEPSGESSDEPAEEAPAEPVEAPDRDYIEVIDDYTLVFHMCTDSQPKLSELMIAQVNITGPEWDTLTDEQKLDWHYACGTGPYILTDYVADNHFTFTKNENYYDYDERYPENKLPYLDTVILQNYKDNTTVMSSFIAGDLDYIPLTCKLSDSEIAQLKQNASYQAYVYPSSAQGMGLKCNQKPFSDINVRIAMQKAINLEEVATAYYGYDSLILPGMWDMNVAGWSAVSEWDDQLLYEYTYDPAEAERLLDEAGYPRGADGTRFTFTVGIDTMADQALFELCKGYFSAVGITMDIKVLSDMSEGREVQGNPDDPRQFNMSLAGGADIGFAYQTYATDGFAYCFYNDDTEFDAMLKNARDAATTSEQAELAKAADRHFSESHIIIALSGAGSVEEFLSARMGGMENGELFNGSHFFKTTTARVWANG